MAAELYCPNIGKFVWPELLGAKGEEAAAKIEQENPKVDAIMVKQDAWVTHDFNCGRVWVWVNDQGVVVKVPQVG